MQPLLAAFETLTASGYAPEMAYLECVHQLVYLADLLHRRGVAGMRRGISGTALFGQRQLKRAVQKMRQAVTAAAPKTKQHEPNGAKSNGAKGSHLNI